MPIVTPDELRPSIDRMAAGEPGVLMSDPVVAFELTGGSSGGGKLVPHSATSLEAFRRALFPWLDDLYGADPELGRGTAYWSISPAGREDRCTAGGIPIGLESDTAYLGPELAAELVGTLSVPPAVARVRDMDAWRQLTTYHLVADADLSLISVWSPTFLLELLRYAEENPARLAESVAAGQPGVAVAADLRAQLPGRAPDPQRARLVAAVLAERAPRFERLWPRLRLISCWDQAASRPYAAEVRRRFPGVPVQGKGLLASEGVVSIPLSGHPLPVLTLESGFYEFLDADGVPRRAHEVISGTEYELLLTNHSGLYRYAIGDRVRVHGLAGRTPMLEFVGRGGLVSDLCGEKLTEEFVLRVLSRFGLRFATLAPHAPDARGYVLLLDAAEVSETEAQALAPRVDAGLEADPQYAYARRLRQLAPLRVVRCNRPLASWIDDGLRRGQRLGDIKPGALYTHGDWQHRFQAVS